MQRGALAGALRLQQRGRIVGDARAIDFLPENNTAALTTPPLCHMANVAQCTLKFAFRDAFCALANR
jgi:hypothetical protein